nr:MAG TPA: hypothetical protein [Caudoviricetes sp.]
MGSSSVYRRQSLDIACARVQEKIRHCTHICVQSLKKILPARA